MVIFLLAAGAILAYGAVYGIYRMKKGGIAAALPVFGLLFADIALLVLLVYYRTNT